MYRNLGVVRPVEKKVSMPADPCFFLDSIALFHFALCRKLIKLPLPRKWVP